LKVTQHHCVRQVGRHGPTSRPATPSLLRDSSAARIRDLSVQSRPESGEDGAVTSVTLEEKADNKTRLVLHELYRSKEARDAALGSGAYDGMDETFEQLDEVLVTLC
jgi:uncharacterized protein YndB with AHSA1/START domain